MAIRSAWYLTKYDAETVAGWLVRKPAICRHFPVEQSAAVWSEVETRNGGCLVKVCADDVQHAVLASDPDFVEIDKKEQAKVENAAKGLGFKKKDVEDCNGDVAALLAVMAMGAKKKVKDADGEIAKRAAQVESVAKAKQVK